MITHAILAAALAVNIAAADVQTPPIWESLGECRITTYCPSCNEPAGYESYSGKTLAAGDCACSWLQIGTRISIDGDEFTVVDTCGTDAIDIFVDSDECRCNLNEYKTVYMEKEQSNDE